MAATIVTTMVMLNAKCLVNPKTIAPTSKPLSSKPISLLSIPNLAKCLVASKPSSDSTTQSTKLAGTTLAGAIFAALNSCEPATAVQQIADIAEGDNRGLALLLPVIPAIAWVLFNILQPALNQVNRMRSERGVIIGLGLGLGGLAASGFFLSTPPHASASEIAVLADASASGDNRGQLLLFVILPAIAWVLFNILQPLLNQINRMRS